MPAEICGTSPSGDFDLAVIGRALGGMEREATLATFDRIPAPHGRIVICGSRTFEANPWRAAYFCIPAAKGRKHRQIYEH